MKLDRNQVYTYLDVMCKKAGCTLKDLEDFITAKKAEDEMFKMAENFEKQGFLKPTDLLSALQALVTIPTAATVAGGALTGLTGYAGLKALQHSDDEYKKKTDIADKYRQATEELLNSR